MSGDSPSAGQNATVTVMARPPHQHTLPLSEAEVAEGQALGEAWHRARAERDAWFVRMELKYRDRYDYLPSQLAKIAGTSRWTYQRAVRDYGVVMDLNDEGMDEGQTA